MNHCNDPKCPLNRQGITHENHELIEGKPITDPCNNPRCALNRMGMRHNVHDEVETDDERKQEQFHDDKGNTQDNYDYNDNNDDNYNDDSYDDTYDDDNYNDDNYDDTYDDDYSDGDDADYNTLKELNKRIYKDNSSSEDETISENTKRERQRIEQEAQEEIRKRERRHNLKEKRSAESATSSRTSTNSDISSIDQILHVSDPYMMFNLTHDATCDEIKAKFKKLSKNFNASRGSATRSRKEQQRLTQAQSKINLAYDFLRKKHCG